jgi:amidohydrolase
MHAYLRSTKFAALVIFGCLLIPTGYANKTSSPPSAADSIPADSAAQDGTHDPDTTPAARTPDTNSLLALYQHLHAHPELSFQEEKTAARFAEELEKIGFVVTRQVGGHGVVGLMHNGAGPTLMLRTDMDGLPIEDQTGLSYASKVTALSDEGERVPVMHGCGHDTHMTVIVGTARNLAAQRDQWNGTLMVIGQPAEERGAGSRAMLKDGLFTRFGRPDFNLAIHGMATLPSTTIGYRSGWAMANVDSVDINVHGIGGHGAYPQQGKDPVVLAASIIMSLQTLVSREIAPIDPAVVTVGSIHGGTKNNIIPDRVELKLTVRSYSDQVREQLLNGIERIAVQQAKSFGLSDELLPEVIVDRSEGTPSLWNDPNLVSRLLPVLRATVGDRKVVGVPPQMGGEDFSRYGRVDPAIPSLMLRLGTVPDEHYQAWLLGERDLPSLHSPFYHPDAQATIDTGVRAMTAAAVELLSGS